MELHKSTKVQRALEHQSIGDIEVLGDADHVDEMVAASDILYPNPPGPGARDEIPSATRHNNNRRRNNTKYSSSL